MTAYAMTADRERFLAAGMDQCVTKPIDFKILARLLAVIAGMLHKENP